tara:strand:+ start:339 stop:617 length:279 start_codon:yes stop_codon:yes gene_type:complete
MANFNPNMQFQNLQGISDPNMQRFSNPNMQGVKNAQPPQRYQVPNAAPIMQNQQPTMGSLSMSNPRSNMQSGQKNAQAPQNYQGAQNNYGGY